jgi:hypothetical protein
MELVKLLSNIVKENTNKKNRLLLEYPESTVKKLVGKFSGQTEDSIEVIKQTISDFERFKGTLQGNERDIFTYDYQKLKDVVNSKSESQKSKKSFDDIYKTFMEKNAGADKRLTKLNIKKFFEMKALDSKKFRKDILTMTSIELSALIRRDFENFMKEKLTEKLVKENPQENIEQVVNRVDRYIANYPLVPINTKPAGMMTFIEFEHVVDVLPMQDEYKMPEVDVNDVDVTYEDDTILIFAPDQKHKCINIRKKFAPDRRWCTSWEGSSNYYYNYRLRQNLTLYYVINKNLKESDVNYAVVILVDNDWRNNTQFRLADGTNSGRFAGSTIMPFSEIVQKIPNLNGKEKYFKPNPYSSEQQSMMMTFERKNLTTDDAIKELGSEENVELWLELRTPDLTTVGNGDQIWANFTPYLRHKYIGMDGKINGEMLKVSDKESKDYYLSKKRKSLLLTDIDKLSEADVSLIMSDEMAPYHEALINSYAKQLDKKNLDLSYLPISFPNDSVAKFAMMFGLETLFEMLPKDTQFINLENKSDKVKPFDVPANISRFKNLKTFVADNIIKSLPESIGECGVLSFLNVTGNKELKTLPKSLSTLYCLTFVSVLDSGIDVDRLPKELFKYMIPTEDFFIVNFPPELKKKRGCKSED